MGELELHRILTGEGLQFRDFAIGLGDYNSLSSSFQLGREKIIVKSKTYAIKDAHQPKLGDWVSDLGQDGIRGSGGNQVGFML